MLYFNKWLTIPTPRVLLTRPRPGKHTTAERRVQPRGNDTNGWNPAYGPVCYTRLTDILWGVL